MSALDCVSTSLLINGSHLFVVWVKDLQIERIVDHAYHPWELGNAANDDAALSWIHRKRGYGFHKPFVVRWIKNYGRNAFAEQIRKKNQPGAAGNIIVTAATIHGLYHAGFIRGYLTIYEEEQRTLLNFWSGSRDQSFDIAYNEIDGKRLERVLSENRYSRVNYSTSNFKDGIRGSFFRRQRLAAQGVVQKKRALKLPGDRLGPSSNYIKNHFGHASRGNDTYDRFIRSAYNDAVYGYIANRLTNPVLLDCLTKVIIAIKPHRVDYFGLGRALSLGYDFERFRENYLSAIHALPHRARDDSTCGRKYHEQLSLAKLDLQELSAQFFHPNGKLKSEQEFSVLKTRQARVFNSYRVITYVPGSSLEGLLIIYLLDRVRLVKRVQDSMQRDAFLQIYQQALEFFGIDDSLWKKAANKTDTEINDCISNCFRSHPRESNIISNFHFVQMNTDHRLQSILTSTYGLRARVIEYQKAVDNLQNATKESNEVLFDLPEAWVEKYEAEYLYLEPLESRHSVAWIDFAERAYHFWVEHPAHSDYQLNMLRIGPSLFDHYLYIKGNEVAALDVVERLFQSAMNEVFETLKVIQKLMNIAHFFEVHGTRTNVNSIKKAFSLLSPEIKKELNCWNRNKQWLDKFMKENDKDPKIPIWLLAVKGRETHLNAILQHLADCKMSYMSSTDSRKFFQSSSELRDQLVKSCFIKIRVMLACAALAAKPHYQSRDQAANRRQCAYFDQSFKVLWDQLDQLTTGIGGFSLGPIGSLEKEKRLVQFCLDWWRLPANADMSALLNKYSWVRLKLNNLQDLANCEWFTNRSYLEVFVRTYLKYKLKRDSSASCTELAETYLANFIQTQINPGYTNPSLVPFNAHGAIDSNTQALEQINMDALCTDVWGIAVRSIDVLKEINRLLAVSRITAIENKTVNLPGVDALFYLFSCAQHRFQLYRGATVAKQKLIDVLTRCERGKYAHLNHVRRIAGKAARYLAEIVADDYKASPNDSKKDEGKLYVSKAFEYLSSVHQDKSVLDAIKAVKLAAKKLDLPEPSALAVANKERIITVQSRVGDLQSAVDKLQNRLSQNGHLSQYEKMFQDLERTAAIEPVDGIDRDPKALTRFYEALCRRLRDKITGISGMRSGMLQGQTSLSDDIPSYIAVVIEALGNLALSASGPATYGIAPVVGGILLSLTSSAAQALYANLRESAKQAGLEAGENYIPSTNIDNYIKGIGCKVTLMYMQQILHVSRSDVTKMAKDWVDNFAKTLSDGVATDTSLHDSSFTMLTAGKYYEAPRGISLIQTSTRKNSELVLGVGIHKGYQISCHTASIPKRAGVAYPFQGKIIYESAYLIRTDNKPGYRPSDRHFTLFPEQQAAQFGKFVAGKAHVAFGDKYKMLSKPHRYGYIWLEDIRAAELHKIELARKYSGRYVEVIWRKDIKPLCAPDLSTNMFEARLEL